MSISEGEIELKLWPGWFIAS